jgi:hypothetical protein
LPEDAGAVDRLVALDEEGKASGIQHTFDIAVFIELARVSR